MQAETIPEVVPGIDEAGAWFVRNGTRHVGPLGRETAERTAAWINRGIGMSDVYASAVPLVPAPWEEKARRFPAAVARVEGELAKRGKREMPDPEIGRMNRRLARRRRRQAWKRSLTGLVPRWGRPKSVWD